MTTNTTERLIKGENVGGEVLAAVCRTENASISWLLEGKGSPYLTHHAASDDEAAALLEQFIEDEEGWSVYQLQGPNGRLAFALTQPARFEKKGEWIDYTELELLVGEVGEKTRAVVNSTNVDLDRHWVDIDERTWSRLQAGQLGTWHMVGDEKNPGLLAGGSPDRAVDNPSEHYVPSLSSRARALGRWFDDLPEERQQALLIFLGINKSVDE